MSTFAGLWGPEFFLDEVGALLPNTPITVRLRGQGTLATLYTNRTKAVGAANPFITDAKGNGWFYADPGLYDIVYGGEILPVMVPTDADEVEQRLQSSEDRLDLIESSLAFHGLNGTIAARPPVADVPEGTEYFAHDVNGGTLYRKVLGAWVKAAPGVNEAAGTVGARMILAGNVDIATVTTVTWQDITGLQVAAVAGPAEAVLDIPVAFINNWGASTADLVSVSIAITDMDGNILRQSGSYFINRYRPKAAADPVAPENTQMVNPYFSIPPLHLYVPTGFGQSMKAQMWAFVSSAGVNIRLSAGAVNEYGENLSAPSLTVIRR